MNTAQTSGDPGNAIFRSQRVLPSPPAAIFEAFARPELLTQWWGPAGFTSTFDVFDFRPGGRWTFVLNGPDGSRHPNECVFLELEAPSRLVIHHVSKPRYLLTVTIAAHGTGSEITWHQQFEDGAVAARIRHIVEPANEQNLDRLASILPDRELEQLLGSFADAWNRHDVDALMSMMTRDAVFEASSGNDLDGERHEGFDAVRAAYVAVFAQYPDAHWGNARHFVIGDRGVSEWTFSGTLEDGRRVEVAGCDLFTFRDGRIAVKNSFRKNR